MWNFFLKLEFLILILIDDTSMVFALIALKFLVEKFYSAPKINLKKKSIFLIKQNFFHLLDLQILEQSLINEFLLQQNNKLV